MLKLQPTSFVHDSVFLMNKIVSFVLYFSSLFITRSVAQGTNVCPKGWNFFEASCYSWLPQMKVGHHEAGTFCEKLNSSFASIRTKGTYKFLREYVLNTEELTYWSALQRCNSTRFFWTDGSPVGFANFARGEPSNHKGKEDCVEMYSDATWNDQDCSKPREFICQNKSCSSIKTSSAFSCLHKSQRKATWFKAQQHCHKLGYVLVKTENAGMNITAVRLAKECDYGCWIGLRKQDVLCWGNDERVALRKSSSPSKDMSGGNECVAMNDYETWRETPCDDKLPFVCEKDANECEIARNECHENALCTNIVGSYTCHCKNGYIGNGKICKEPDDFDVTMINIKDTNEVKSVIKTCASVLGQGNGTEAVINILEDITLSVGSRMKHESGNGTNEFVIKEKNIMLGVVAVKKKEFQGFTFPDDVFVGSGIDEKMVFPKSILLDGDNNTAVVVGMVYNTTDEMDSIEADNWFVNSKTVAGIVDPAPPLFRKNPVKIVFKKLKNVANGKVQCVFWKFRKGDKGIWSSDGCHVFHSNATHVTCECYHLTNFAILMRIDTDKVSDEDNIVLNVITLVGLSMSIIGCFLTFAVHLYFRKLRRDRGFIHINLVSALGLADVVFMIAILIERDHVSCTLMALLMFYFFLAMFFWMLVEGIHIYFMVTKVFDTKGRKIKLYYSITGWILPLVIVSLTYASLRSDVLSNDYCWLSVSSGAIWGFVGPVTFIILVNVVIMVLVLKVTLTMLPEDPENGKIKSAFRTFLMLTPLLGVTWIFGLLTITKHSNVFQYLFAILNSFQGFIIFVLYCLFNKEARKELKRKIKSIRSSREITTSQRRSSLSAKGGGNMSRSSSKSSLGGTANKDTADNRTQGRFTQKNKNDITGNPITTVNGASVLNLGLETEKPMPEIYPLEKSHL